MTATEQPISLYAMVKINLYLHITGLRKNGYHDLDSLVTFAGIYDTVHLVPSDELSLVVKGPFRKQLPLVKNNIVLKAATTLKKVTGSKAGVQITLEKNLPVASGIGGGSMDCAAALKGLIKFWNIDTSTIDLVRLGLRLGSDVPICLFGQTAFISGRGEIITKAPALPKIWFVLVNPGVELSTKAVFESHKVNSSNQCSKLGQFDKNPATAIELANLLSYRNNDLTEAAINLQPVIKKALLSIQDTENVLVSRMAGSGATCFGVYKDYDSAKNAAKYLNNRYPSWWICPAPIINNLQ